MTNPNWNGKRQVNGGCLDISTFVSFCIYSCYIQVMFLELKVLVSTPVTGYDQVGRMLMLSSYLNTKLNIQYIDDCQNKDNQIY